MNTFWNYERTRKTGLASSFFLALVLVSAFSAPAAMADDNDRRGRGSNNNRGDNSRRSNVQQRVESRRNNIQTRVENRQDNRRADAFRQNRGAASRNQNRAEAFRHNNNNNRAAAFRHNNNNRADAIRAQNRANNFQNSRANNNRWDRSDRRRYQAQRQFNNWNDQRTYLRSNLSRFNQLSRLNQLQRQQLDNQMRSAFLAYHNNQWAGSYGWNEYSDPMFLDYLQTNNSSLLQSILAAIGLVGGGLGGGNRYMVDDGYGYGRFDGYDGYVGGDYGEELY